MELDTFPLYWSVEVSQKIFSRNGEVVSCKSHHVGQVYNTANFNLWEFDKKLSVSYNNI